MKSKTSVVKISSLTPDDHNANLGSERGAEMIQASLRNYGAGRSILLDKDGRIIAGNKTAENAVAAGMEDVIVVESDGTKLIAVKRTDLDLNDPKARELAVADNRAGEVSLTWNIEELGSMLQDPNIDLDQFFTRDELVELEIPEELLPPAESTISGDEDEVPETPVKPVSQLGDLYVLGKHRLLCGDATKADAYTRLLNGASAGMCWTDPPYNVEIVGGNHSLSPEQRKKAGGQVIKNDSMSDQGFSEFLGLVFNNIFAALSPGSACYVAFADVELRNFASKYLDAGFKLAQMLVWLKNSLVMGRKDYHFIHEPILYGWKVGAGHRWFGDRSQTTVLRFDRPSRSEDHPTMKPVALVEYCISNSSAQNDVILDPFGGSGTTLVACEKTGRVARLMEIDPKYVDVIVRRWMLLTGKTAKRYNVEGKEVPLGALANPKM